MTVVAIDSEVTVIDEQTKAEHCYRIVHYSKRDPANGSLSSDSPVAKALQGKSLGETVTIPLPHGKCRNLKISAIV